MTSMQKLRIAVITMEFVTEKYFSGGIANHWYRLFKAISQLGHEVHIITLSDKNNESFEYDGLQVHRIQVKHGGSRFQRVLNRLTKNRLKNTVQKLDFSWEAYQKLKQLHKQHPFDIAHFPNSYGCGLFSSLLMRLPYVVMISCYRPAWNESSGVKRDRDTKAIEWLEWLQYRISPHVYGPSYVLKKVLEEEAKISNVRVIRTPIYLETSNLDSSIYDEHLSGKQYLMFFGRYQLHKGFHILAQALPKVLQTYPDLHAVFVGLDLPSKLAPSMKEYAQDLAKENRDRLIFLSQLPHNQLYPVIKGAKLVVLPSLVDNLPNTLMESMALGKPVIGTIGASFDEMLVDGENGFLVPIGDSNALADKIIEAWTHPNLDAIGQAALRKVEELSPERTVQDLLNYYEEVIKSK
jgi:glycosyltransferase involved in cell wall biosynthesis